MKTSITLHIKEFTRYNCVEFTTILALYYTTRLKLAGASEILWPGVQSRKMMAYSYADIIAR